MTNSKLNTVYNGGDVTRKQPTLNRRTDKILNSIADESQVLTKGIVAYEMILIGNSGYDDVFSLSESILFDDLEHHYGSDVRDFFARNKMIDESAARGDLSNRCEGGDAVKSVPHCSLWMPTELTEQLKGHYGLGELIEDGLLVYIDAPYSDRLNRSKMVSNLINVARTGAQIDSLSGYVQSIVELEDESLEAQIGDIIESVIETGDVPDYDSEDKKEISTEEETEDERGEVWEQHNYLLDDLRRDVEKGNIPKDKRRLEAYSHSFRNQNNHDEFAEMVITTPHMIRAHLMDIFDISERTAYNWCDDLKSDDKNYGLAGLSVNRLWSTDFKDLLERVSILVDKPTFRKSKKVIVPDRLVNPTAFGRPQPKNGWRCGPHMEIIDVIKNKPAQKFSDRFLQNTNLDE